jgi:acetylornithine deacetylase/succinyl-diaminopimelate desuccinylase-like protein
LRLDLAGGDREKALKSMRKAAGEGFQVTDEGALVRLALPQESYQGGSHGSVPEREQDAVDRLGGALGRVRKAAPKNALSVVDCFTGKSTPAGVPGGQPTRARATLDLRLAVDDDRPAFLADLARAAGPEFELKPLYGPELTDSLVRRLSHQSPLFQAAERQTQRVFGDLPILFGNTTATNDVRNLMSLRPDSEALMFTPVEFAGNGAHAPDEHVPVDSLVKGVDWCEGLMRDLGNCAERAQNTQL